MTYVAYGAGSYSEQKEKREVGEDEKDWELESSNLDHNGKGLYTLPNITIVSLLAKIKVNVSCPVGVVLAIVYASTF